MWHKLTWTLAIMVMIVHLLEMHTAEYGKLLILPYKEIEQIWTMFG